MQIPLFKPHVNPIALDGLAEIFESGWIGLGPKTEEFEKEFCKYTGSKYAVAVNSCTSALHLALICAGAGDEKTVVSTPMTFVSTNQAISYTGAQIKFVDILPDTLSMDPESFERSIKDQGPPSVVVVVHYGGMPAEMKEILRLAHDSGTEVVWDCAHAMGASYKGDKIGSFEKLACFSFHAVKNLGIGDGGMIATNDEKIYHRLRRLRWMGVDSSTFERTTSNGYKWMYSVSELGYKYHMNDIAAVIGLAQIKDLEWQNERRRMLGLQYQHMLADNWASNGDLSIVNPYTSNRETAQHLFVIRVKRGSRDGLHSYLLSKGITTGVHYYPNHLYSMFYGQHHCQQAVRAFEEILSLPMYWQMEIEEQEYVCEAIKSYFRRL